MRVESSLFTGGVLEIKEVGCPGVAVGPLVDWSGFLVDESGVSDEVLASWPSNSSILSGITGMLAEVIAAVAGSCVSLLLA